ncbi:MAG: type II toxin-antitoxin system BrnA family antitoxin [Longimicrobiales bacterium]
MSITTEELDRMFDDGEDIDQYIDWSKARRPGLEPRRVNVDLPSWMVDALDREAQRLGVPRQSVIKVWIAEKLEAVEKR